MSTEVRCQGCETTKLVSEDVFKAGLLDGSIVTGSYTSRQQVGSGETDFRTLYHPAFLTLCKLCLSQSPNDAHGENTRAVSIPIECAEIQRILKRVREMNPDWTLEDAAHEAVERYNDVSKVRNEGFRVYLMEQVHA